MISFSYHFPAMAKLSEWSNLEQMAKIQEEVGEALNALDNYRMLQDMNALTSSIMEERWSYGMELFDAIHAAETALRMEFSPEEAKELRDAVEEKNRERRYYDAA